MLTLKEVQSVFPNLRDAALLLLLQNPGWTPRQFRQYRKIDRALSDALYTVYSQMYTARWFNYPAQAVDVNETLLGFPTSHQRKGGIMDGSLTPTGRLVANKEVSNLLLPSPYSYTSSPSLVITRQHYYNLLFKFGEKKESEYAPGSVPVRNVSGNKDEKVNKRGGSQSKPAVYPALKGHDRYPNPSCFCRACKDHRAEASRLNQLGLGSEPNAPAANFVELGGAEGHRTYVGSSANGQPRTWTDVGVLVNSQRFDRPVVQGAGATKPDTRTELDLEDPVALLKQSMALTERALKVIERALREGDWA